MNFVLMDEEGLQILPSWFADPILRRWSSPPSDNWLKYVQNEPGVYAWMVYDDSIPIGQLQVDIHENGVGYIAFAVNPALRRQGYGKRMLIEFLARPEIAQVNKLIGEVESGNIASIACLRSVGFTQDNSPPIEDGFLQFVFKPQQKPSP
jgi:RimJ/RimL family protein N-acetyltransferase